MPVAPASQRPLAGAAVGGASGLTATILDMTWPPQIGDPLPRAGQAWYEPAKFEDWIFAERGHGREWRRVFHVGLEDRGRVWEAIVATVEQARIAAIRGRGAKGIVFSVQVELMIGDRTAPVTICWHYATERSAPRLVTAYVSL